MKKINSRFRIGGTSIRMPSQFCGIVLFIILAEKLIIPFNFDILAKSIYPTLFQGEVVLMQGSDIKYLVLYLDSFSLFDCLYLSNIYYYMAVV